MKNLVHLLDKFVEEEEEGADFRPKSRPFRKVLEAVQAGQEELGDVPSDISYHFHSEAEIDMDLPSDMFISKNHYGHVDSESFAERLRDRLGITPDSPDSVVTEPPAE